MALLAGATKYFKCSIPRVRKVPAGGRKKSHCNNRKTLRKDEYVNITANNTYSGTGR